MIRVLVTGAGGSPDLGFHFQSEANNGSYLAL